MQAIRELELKVTTMPPPTGGGCTKPTLAMQPKGAGSISNDEAEHGTLIKNMFSIIKSAFQCDATRVATITFANGNSNLAQGFHARGDCSLRSLLWTPYLESGATLLHIATRCRFRPGVQAGQGKTSTLGDARERHSECKNRGECNCN